MNGVTPTSIRDSWRTNLRKFPNRPAFVYEGIEHTYAACDEMIERLRGALAERFGQIGAKLGRQLVYRRVVHGEHSHVVPDFHLDGLVTGLHSYTPYPAL